MAADEKPQKEPLRQRAEKVLSKKSPLISKIEAKDIKKLVHYLQVHQIELEMQNEELREAQEKIEQSRQKYSDLYEFAPIGYFTFSPSGEILEVNLTGASLLGIERGKLIHTLFVGYVETEFRSHFREHCRNTLNGGQSERCDLRLMKKDGNSFDASLQSILVRHDHNLRIRSAISDITELKKAQMELNQLNTELEDRIIRRTTELKAHTEQLKREITDRKRAEEALLENQALLRAIMETTPDPVYVKDIESRIIMANPALAKVAGKPLEEILGRTDGEYYGDLVTGQALREHDLRVMESGQSEVAEETVPTPMGYRTFLSTKTPYRNPSGDIIGITGISRDITERKRMEEELRKSRDELEERIEERTVELRKASLYSRSLIEASLDPLVTINADGKVMDVNRATELVTGVARGQLIGSDFSDYFTEPEKAKEGYKRVFSEGSVRDYSLAIRHTSGRVAEVLYNAAVYKNEAEEVQGVFAAVRDITERKRAEEALRESESRLRVLSSRLLAAQEKERKLVAQEIHDSIGASLAATKFKVEATVIQVGDTDPQTVKALRSLIPIVQGTIDEARRIQMALRPSILDDLGILATINWFSRQYESTYPTIHIQKEINVEEAEVPRSLKIAIYRIIQEAMNNIAKHSKASEVLLDLRKAEKVIHLVIQDSGRGFDLEEAYSRKGTTRGFGLDSMRERTELSGGSFSVESHKGAGTVIRASWPL